MYGNGSFGGGYGGGNGGAWQSRGGGGAGGGYQGVAGMDKSHLVNTLVNVATNLLSGAGQVIT